MEELYHGHGRLGWTLAQPTSGSSLAKKGPCAYLTQNSVVIKRDTVFSIEEDWNAK